MPSRRLKLTQSNEYKNLCHVVPSLRRQRDVGKVEVVTEAARYIDYLHKTLIERFVVCGISDSLKEILGTDNAHELNSQHIMNLVTRMAAAQRQVQGQRQVEREEEGQINMGKKQRRLTQTSQPITCRHNINNNNQCLMRGKQLKTKMIATSIAATSSKRQRPLSMGKINSSKQTTRDQVEMEHEKKQRSVAQHWQRAGSLNSASCKQLYSRTSSKNHLAARKVVAKKSQKLECENQLNTFNPTIIYQNKQNLSNNNCQKDENNKCTGNSVAINEISNVRGNPIIENNTNHEEKQSLAHVESSLSSEKLIDSSGHQQPTSCASSGKLCCNDSGKHNNDDYKSNNEEDVEERESEMIKH